MERMFSRFQKEGEGGYRGVALKPIGSWEGWKRVCEEGESFDMIVFHPFCLMIPVNFIG
jgi:hypothetical protein